MNDRDCENCKHHTEKGCDSWDCKFEPCEDAISRQAVEDAIAETIVNGESLGYAIAQEIVSDLPPVKPQEPKTGHWKPYLKEGLRYQCSVCDSRFDTPWEYCPHCGAKMVEPQESEG